jgi:hypothetical protein
MQKGVCIDAYVWTSLWSIHKHRMITTVVAAARPGNHCSYDAIASALHVPERKTCPVRSRRLPKALRRIAIRCLARNLLIDRKVNWLGHFGVLRPNIGRHDTLPTCGRLVTFRRMMNIYISSVNPTWYLVHGTMQAYASPYATLRIMSSMRSRKVICRNNLLCHYYCWLAGLQPKRSSSLCLPYVALKTT